MYVLRGSNYLCLVDTQFTLLFPETNPLLKGLPPLGHRPVPPVTRTHPVRTHSPITRPRYSAVTTKDRRPAYDVSLTRGGNRRRNLSLAAVNMVCVDGDGVTRDELVPVGTHTALPPDIAAESTLPDATRPVGSCQHVQQVTHFTGGLPRGPPR